MKYIKTYEASKDKSLIKELDLCNEELTVLPDLSEYTNLEDLYCEYNQLTSLPELPKTLKNLYCYNNQLVSLPELPDTLISIVCGNNILKELPKLPKKLVSLNCVNNNIKKISILPETLKFLWCNDNIKLKEIGNCPDSLQMLDCSGTELPYEDIYEFRHYYKNVLYPELGAAEKYNV